ncbi:MAG: ribosomal L7Ae/L30e/S12e/Gadd45 family protein [Lachnospiraceae bacterium]|nr:ribosomal L7Ae/L30e/S12e/Gadd45 family protein [Lachnospiraceae bacterium]
MKKYQDRVLSMLGMAKRAGRLVSGEFAVEKAVKTGKASLVVVASDASENTKKSFQNMCAYYGVPCRIGAEKELLGHAVGQGMRASLAVTDENFARTIEKCMNENTDGGSENGE